jgi:hypothetical protein
MAFSRRFLSTLLFLVAVLLAAPTPSQAIEARTAGSLLETEHARVALTADPQETSSTQDTSDVERLVRRALDRLFGEQIELGALVQTVGQITLDPPATDPGTNQFNVATTRLKLSGSGPSGFRYMAQTDFTRSLVLLDARIGYRFGPGATLRAGLFKAPFSGEFLTSAANIDFVNRSRVVSSYAPNRQVGASLYGETGGPVGYEVGIFNGNGRTLSGNDNNRFMYTGRLTFSPELQTGSLKIGTNVAFSEDAHAGFRGSRTLIGVDARFERGPLLLSGELIRAELDPTGASEREPLGYHLTAGFAPVPGRHQLVARLDQIDHDTLTDTPTQVVFGYNLFATEAYGLQLNYVLPFGDGADTGDHQILANFQVAL